MTEQSVPPVVPGVSSDDRMWVLLCFLFTPLFPLITLFLDDKKNRPFIKYHNVPALILGIVLVIVVGVLQFIPIVGCIAPLLWIINILFAVKAYKGVNTDIPVITKFSQDQKWS
jgi:uncharacterized membrane protein